MQVCLHSCFADLLQPLGVYLTNEDDVKRGRAVSFLATVLNASPEIITTPEHMHHLAEFFTSRLVDWVALRGALEGCAALLREGVSERAHGDQVVGVGLSEADAVDMLRTISDGVYVRSLAAKDRSLVFAIVRKLVERAGLAALDAEVDLAEMMVVSMDGEKDPGCLLDAFHAAQSVLRLFSGLESRADGGAEMVGTSVHVDMMRNAEDEMFDILACYFPVSFEPREDSARRITRDDLARALEETLLLWPGFYAAVLDMAEEKLGSIVKQAKIDSLRLIRGLCDVREGREVVARERRRVWAMMRQEVMKETIGSLEGVDGTNFTCVDCLSACLGVPGVEREVLGDVVVGDCMACLQSPPGTGEVADEAFRRQADLVRCTGVIFRAVSSIGGKVWQEALVTYAGEILSVCSEGDVPVHVCFSLILLHSLVAGVRVVEDDFMSNGKGGAVIRRIQEIGVSFADDLQFVDPRDNVVETLPGADSSAAAFATPSTAVMAKIKLCEAMVCGPAFVDAWNEDRIRSLVVECARVVLCEYTALASGARRSLEHICVSATGSRFGARHEAMNVLLDHLGSASTSLDASHRIFLFLGSACRADLSLRGVVLREACSRSQSLPILTRGIATLEGELRVGPGNIPAIPEEVAALETILDRASTEEQSSVDDESLARAAFYICRRMTPDDQRCLTALESVPAARMHVNGALLGCIIGLHPEVVLEHADVFSDLVLKTSTVSLPSMTASWSLDGTMARLASCAIASIANKIAAASPDTVVDGVTSLSAASRWEVVEEVMNALAKQAGPVLEDVLRLVTEAKQYSALRYLISPRISGMSFAPWISTDSHATVAFLWQQKAYTKAKQCLMEGAPGSDAMIHLISGLPPSLVRADKHFVCGEVCSFLESSVGSETFMGDAIQERILRLFTDNGLIALPETSERLGRILPALLQISLSAQHAGSRQAALECLVKIAVDVPYQNIHPYRRAIVQTATAASDDNKRAVRAVAVRCRALFDT